MIPGPGTNTIHHTQLTAEIGGTSANRNGIGTLGMVVSDPPTQSEGQALADRLDELINTLRR